MMKFNTAVSLAVAVCLGLVATASGHICILSPPQRGKLSVSVPGDSSCYRRTGYCGGIDIMPVQATYVAGSTVDITFQQNLNHWYEPNPGFFDIALSYSLKPQDSDFQTLATLSDYPANDMVTQTNFTVSVTFPPKPCEHCILRARYVAHNPDEVDPKNNTDAIFYNCADIALVAAPSTPSAMAAAQASAPAKPQLRRPLDGPSCVTPGAWEATALETNSLGAVSHHIWYDKAAQKVRWDRAGQMGDAFTNLTLISEYGSSPEIEWVIYHDTDSCLPYGPDPWYDWSYGVSKGQFYDGNVTVGTQVFDKWVLPSANVHWLSRPYGDYCLPVARNHGSVSLVFQDVKVGPVDPSVFTRPANCKMPSVMAEGCADEVLVEKLKAQLGVH